MMHEWTPDASASLHRYLDAVRRAMPSEMDEPEEILSSLADHLTAESESKSTGIVQRDDVERVIGVVGTPAQIVSGWEGATDGRPARASADAPAPRARRARHSISLGCFGVFLPVVAITTELLFGLMRSGYVDPMPSSIFLALLICVPVGSLYLLRMLRRKDALSVRQRNAVFAVTGALMAITSCYALAYLPTLPFSFVGILVLGLGILGLTPHLACVGMLYTSAVLSEQFPSRDPLNRKTRRCWCGGAASVLLLFLLMYARIVVLEHGMQLAVEAAPEKQASAYRLLRYTAGESYVLDRCYRFSSLGLNSVVAPVFLDVLLPPDCIATPSQARAAFYLLTGDSFTKHSRPWRFSDRWPMPGLSEEDFAGGVTYFGGGGSRPGSEIYNLTLAESRLDGTLFADKAGNSGESTAYLEWVITFTNSSNAPQESRTLLHLPPGAVASRLTLWINGEEREAAFGGREQVRAAYQEVAFAQRRDPALLTTQGPDRVLLQCFPVPARGELKVKLGVTVPLTTRDGQAYLRLPEILERNYALKPSGKHHVWIESLAPLSTNRMELAKETIDGVHALRGELSLASENGSWMGWVATPATPLPRHYTAKIGELDANMSLNATPASLDSTGPVWLVVDAGAAMHRVSIDWAAVLAAFPEGTEFHVRFVGPDSNTLTTSNVAELTAWLKGVPQFGAWQPLPAIEAAWSEASALDKSRMLWIHAPYPIAGPMTASLEQVLLRRPPVSPSGAPRLFDVQISPGPNRILESLGPIRGMAVVPIIGNATDSLRYFAKTGRLNDVQRSYNLEDDAVLDWPDADSGSDHVVRLAAYDAVLKMLANKNDEDAKAALALAQRLRLVTPVSGAVVLEQKVQYERHGLNPKGDPDAIAQVPAIPEPEEWAMILVAVVAMLAMMLQRRRAGSRAVEVARS